MKPKKVRELINDALYAQIHANGIKRDMPQPFHIQGPPGIGKSAIPKMICAEMKVGFIDNRPALRDPTDYRGIPAIVENRAVWLQPSDLPTPWYCLICERPLSETQALERDSAPDSVLRACKFCGSPTVDAGILFLDELDAAPPTTQAGCYQLVLDRMIGEYHLPAKWLILAAGNRIEDRAVTYRLSSALANRFTHIEFEVSLDDWVEWALTDGRIDANIIAFLKFRGGDLLFAFDPKSSEKAFPTPRTWEFASKSIEFIRKRELLAEVLQGTIGPGATAEFVNFLKVQTELPDLEPILAGKNSYVPPDKRLDLKYALVSALATRAHAKSGHFENLIKYSEKLSAEFSVLLMQMLASKDEKGMVLCPSFSKWCREHQDIIRGRV